MTDMGDAVAVLRAFYRDRGTAAEILDAMDRAELINTAGGLAAAVAFAIDDLETLATQLELQHTGRRSAHIELEMLTRALDHTRPSCANDERFTLEEPTDQAELRQICRGCPIRRACEVYADAAHPPGFWAGRAFPHSPPPTLFDALLEALDVARAFTREPERAADIVYALPTSMIVDLIEGLADVVRLGDRTPDEIADRINAHTLQGVPNDL